MGQRQTCARYRVRVLVAIDAVVVAQRARQWQGVVWRKRNASRTGTYLRRL